MEMTYLKQPPKKYTFEQVKLKQYVESYCIGKVLNLFAGKVKLNVNEIRVDISNEYKPDYCVDAYKFITSWRNNKFDTVILDPPYNIRKSREKYYDRWIGSLTKIKNYLPNIIKNGGRIISLGYDTVGMSNNRGFRKIALCVVCHGGDHNDTLCLVEEFCLSEMGQKIKLNIGQDCRNLLIPISR